MLVIELATDDMEMAYNQQLVVLLNFLLVHRELSQACTNNLNNENPQK
jgi:hypothetical protein